MTTPLPQKDLRVIFKSLEEQGCEVRQTRAGWRIFFPDGSTFTVHPTAGDRRARMNFRARIRRSGCTWPFDK